MGSNEKTRLWDSSLGIRFGLGSRAQSLYPQLDLPRFLSTHGPYYSSSTNGVADTTVSWACENRDDVIPESSASAAPSSFNAPHLHAEVHAVDETGLETHVPPPITALDYNISSELFNAARKALKGSPQSYWSHTMYENRRPDGTAEKVKVHYCTSKHTTEYVCRKHFLGQKILGFDLEWFPYATKQSGPRQNVSLIQIASPGRIGLFHVALFPLNDDLVAPALKEIMEDPSVSKVGVNIQADCTRLNNNLKVNTRGMVELSHFYKLVKYSAQGCTKLINRQRVALAVQVEEFLYLPLYKGDSVRSSNWTLPLTSRQINYSAADAYAGLQLFYVLDQERKKLKPTPPQPRHAELGLPIQTALPDLESSSDTDGENAVASVKATPKTKPSAQQIDPRITKADASLREYRNDVQRPLKAAPSAMRTYYIWHANEDLDPEAIARMLRNPPLKTNTIVTYILDSISAEDLPFSPSRLKKEVLSHLAVDVSEIRRYRSLAEAYRGS